MYSFKLESIFSFTASLILIFGITALAFFIFEIIVLSSFKEKLGLATSCIKTFLAPLLLIRYFNALKGLGATARLVMLPKESHGYRAKESILHLLWEQDEWLQKYVKNKKSEK